jgi:hypothetical protein
VARGEAQLPAEPYEPEKVTPVSIRGVERALQVYGEQKGGVAEKVARTAEVLAEEGVPPATAHELARKATGGERELGTAEKVARERGAEAYRGTAREPTPVFTYEQAQNAYWEWLTSKFPENKFTIDIAGRQFPLMYRDFQRRYKQQGELGFSRLLEEKQSYIGSLVRPRQQRQRLPRKGIVRRGRPQLRIQ